MQRTIEFAPQMKMALTSRPFLNASAVGSQCYNKLNFNRVLADFEFGG